jgi:hypothetical protein
VGSKQALCRVACLRLLDRCDSYSAGAGCSTTSTATFSTAVATGGATFFAALRLGLALATTRFVAFPAAFLAFGSDFAPFLFWTFDDFFLRLAIVDPLFWLALCKRIDANSQKTTRPESRQPTLWGYQQTLSGLYLPYPHLSTLHMRR